MDPNSSKEVVVYIFEKGLYLLSGEITQNSSAPTEEGWDHILVI